MTQAAHPTGTVQSADVTLFYRRFGRPGGAPIVILHGANYYDSADWIEIASALSHDREVVAFDMRGFGASSWSTSRDYSLDATLADILAVLDHCGWEHAIVMGHSMGGSYALLFAARHRERTAGLILGDHCPGEGGAARAPNAAPATAAPATAAKPFPTLEAALAATSRDPRTPLARVNDFCRAVDGGFVFRRDPSFGNKTPTTPGWTAKIVVADAWAELAGIDAPILVIRGLQSDRYTPERVARVLQTNARAEVVDVASGHDIATVAPQPVIDAISRFATQIDAERPAS